VLAAILVIEIEDVFVARMAWEGQICASCANILLLRSGISCVLSDHVPRIVHCGTYRNSLNDKVDI
jgi:hypothetical protein